MRITDKLLVASNKTTQNHDENALFLSSLNIVLIENLHKFSNLKYLDLSNNNLEFVENLELCTELWHLNLSNNKIQRLDGLSPFIAFGSLFLSNNQLDWHSLQNIRHLHVISLCLNGNPKLEPSFSNKRHYRTHVIDSFPLIWSLDGCFITSAERLQVHHIFQKTALSNKPLRHQYQPNEQFKTTAQKTVWMTGSHGTEAAHLLLTVPNTNTGVHNSETDLQRLEFLAFTVQSMISLVEPDNPINIMLKTNHSFLQHILAYREKGDLEKDKSNMLVLLLLCSLEFTLPTQIIKETLAVCELSDIGEIETLDIFLLPKIIRCWICQVLYAATKIDLDQRESGVYSKLFEALFLSMNQLTQVQNSKDHDSAVKHRNRFDKQGMRSYRSLLAAELLYQFCLVPTFYEWIPDLSVMYLVVLGSGNIQLPEKLNMLLREEKYEDDESTSVYETISGFLCRAINGHVAELCALPASFSGTPFCVVSGGKSLPRQPVPRTLFSSSFLTLGRTPPDSRPSCIAVSDTRGEERQVPLPDHRPDKAANLGEEVLLGPQSCGKIVSIPDSCVALVQLNSITALNGGIESTSEDPSEHFVYVDLTQMRWGADEGRWKPKGAYGDRITLRNVSDTAALATAPYVGQSLALRQRSVRSAGPSKRGGHNFHKQRPLSAVIGEKGGNFLHPMELAERLKLESDEAFLRKYNSSLAQLRREQMSSTRLPYSFAATTNKKEFSSPYFDSAPSSNIFAQSPAPTTSPRNELEIQRVQPEPPKTSPKNCTFSNPLFHGVNEFSPRQNPLSAIDVYKFVVSSRNRGFNTSRTAMATGKQTAAAADGQVEVQQANQWLAGGRDLFTERRMTAASQPVVGWKEGSQHGPGVKFNDCHCRQNRSVSVMGEAGWHMRRTQSARALNAPTRTTQGVVCQACHRSEYSKLYR